MSPWCHFGEYHIRKQRMQCMHADMLFTFRSKRKQQKQCIRVHTLSQFWQQNFYFGCTIPLRHFYLQTITSGQNILSSIHCFLQWKSRLVWIRGEICTDQMKKVQNKSSKQICCGFWCERATGHGLFWMAWGLVNVLQIKIFWWTILVFSTRKDTLQNVDVLYCNWALNIQMSV